MEDVAVSPNGEILALMSDKFISPSSNNYYVVPINTGTMLGNGYRLVHANNFYFPLESFFLNQKFVSSLDVYSNSYNGRVVSLDMLTGIHWTKIIRNHYIAGPSINLDAEGNIFIANGVPDFSSPYFQDRVLELYKLDVSGNIVWKKGLILSKDGTYSGSGIYPQEIELGENGQLYISGRILDATDGSLDGLQFIIKTDSIGNPLIWKTFTHRPFGDLLYANGELYLLDKSSHLPYTGTTLESSVLLKLDKDLNLIWSKKYYAENFRYVSASVNKLPSGNLLMSHSAYGAYPVILSEIDDAGNILSQKGYPNHTPFVNIINDGSFLLSSANQFDSTGQTTMQMTIAKTDANGYIAGCTNYPTCLQVDDFEIETDSFTIDIIDALDLESDYIDVTPYSFTFSPFCDYAPPPVPDFDFPDTLCIGESAQTTNTYNELAQTSEWHLVGPNTDSVLIDSSHFGYHFATAGDYKLTQTIWVLGCSYSFEREISILPPLEISLYPENICPDSAHEIHIVSVRPIQSYFWDNGTTTPTLQVFNSGIHSITVSDGHCEATDSVSVTIVQELLGNNPPFTLPPDTITCLPFELEPHSLFASQFFTETVPTAATSFLLENAGSYRIGMEAFGCKFWEVYEYGVDCHADIYIPTSFSPNGDGINDVFMPFGTDFEVLELSIFDRWGGLRSKGKDWDGGTAGQAVYAYKLTYRDLLTLKKEVVQGEVTLLK